MSAVGRSFSDILQSIVRNVQEIVRSEVRLAKIEIREEAVKAKSASLFLGTGAVIAIFAILFLLLTIIYALALVIPIWAAALIVGAALAVTASMPDVLFDTGKADLRAGARERLAKVAGILIAYPDIQVEIDGYTDNTGAAAFNQQLSEERAQVVRDYISQQGVPTGSISVHGFGEDSPLASNDTPSGRQQNRRVELVVSGQSIGAQSRP